LDVGEFRHDDKSMKIAEMLLELLEQTNKDSRDEISEHAQLMERENVQFT
jgi:hypothetical protein